MTTRTLSPADRGSTIPSRPSGRSRHEALAREAIARLAGTRPRPQPQTQPEAARNVGFGQERRLDPSVIEGFLDLLLKGDTETAAERVGRLRMAGFDYISLAEHLFAPTARLLGGRWDENRLSFLEVSLGISGLLAVNARLRAAYGVAGSGTRGQLLFATLPQQAHTLGAILAAEAFRQRDYDVELMLGATPEDIEADVRLFDIRVVGLTAGAEDRIADLESLAARLKHLPRAPMILIGGGAAARASAALSAGGIDCIARTIEEAIAFTDNLPAGSI